MFIAAVLVTLSLGFAVYWLRRSFAANIALVLLSISLCFTLAEGYFRFFYVRSDGFGRLERNFAARYYHLDQFGLRDSHLPLSTAQKNVVVLGDSFVFGAGLKSTSERFCEQLATRYPQYHFVNIGSSGWDTRTQIEQVKKYVVGGDAAVPLVILVYFFNDIEEDVTAADRARITPPVAPTKETAIDRALQRVSDSSRFIEFVYFRARYPRLVSDRLTQIQMFYDDPEIRARHLATLEQLRTVLAEHCQAKLLVAVLPYLHSDELLNRSALYRPFETALDEHGFSRVDLQPVFAKHGVSKLQVNRFDPHTNVFANELMAASVAEYLSAHPQALQP